MHSLIQILKSWSDITDSRSKLQQAYLASALALLIIAGMVGLINYNLGPQVLFLALLAGAIFIVNAVAWALLQSFVLLHLTHEDTPKPTTKSDTKSRPPKKTSTKK